jgi:Uma2 family endonuclease
LFLTPYDEEWYLQGYEPLVAPRLIEQYQEENITSDIKIVPAVQWTDSIGKTHVYRCDFYVESLKLIIEVKSTWTAQKDEEKIKKCMDYWSNQGNTYRLIISDNKGNYLYDRTNHDILSIPFDWHKSP